MIIHIRKLLTSNAKDQTKATISNTLHIKHRVELVKSDTYKMFKRISKYKINSYVKKYLSKLQNLPEVLQHTHSTAL